VDAIPGGVGNAQCNVPHVWLYGALRVANSRYHAHRGTKQDRYTERKPISYTTTYIDRTKTPNKGNTSTAQEARTTAPIYHRTQLPPHPSCIALLISRSSFAWASSEGVRQWQEWQRRFTHSWKYRNLGVVISRIIAGRERAKKQSLIHTLAAMLGDGEDGRKDQHW
jgi:hypothetical protein